MTPQHYLQCALRTLYPDLTTNERLGLCGLGLSSEIGEVTDLLKKFLYHRNGKPLVVDKLEDELGDMCWYLFILLDTSDIKFEEVVPVNCKVPSLPFKECLESCALGLVVKTGKVVELLYAHLYHDEVLSIDNLKDRLRDMLRHFSMLLDILGITFEEVMEASAAKLEARHPHGFNPHYASDSGASE